MKSTKREQVQNRNGWLGFQQFLYSKPLWRMDTLACIQERSHGVGVEERTFLQLELGEFVFASSQVMAH